MQLPKIFNFGQGDALSTSQPTAAGSEDFSKYLQSVTSVPMQHGAREPTTYPGVVLQPGTHQLTNASQRDAAAAYARQASSVPALSSLQKYKDDQLLSNPGGDHYDLQEKRSDINAQGKQSFAARVGKDLCDAWSNCRNFVGNLLFGAKMCYRDEDNQIKEATQRGLVGSLIDFAKDLGSAVSFGFWRPDGEQHPQGLAQRMAFSFSKLKEAIFGDLVEGVTGSVNHMAEDLTLAGWNLLETVPDATIGNLQSGEKLTTAVFDNGQVIIDYATDVLPAGEAWQRVHAMDLEEMHLPIAHNLKMPERYAADSRWQFVRNTSFRKAIETVGSLFADVLTLKFLGQAKFLSEKRHNKN